MKYFVRFQTLENKLNDSNLAILKPRKYSDKYTPLNYRHLYEAMFFDTPKAAKDFLVSKEFKKSFYSKWLQKREDVSIDIKEVSDEYYAEIKKNESELESNRDRELSGKLWEEDKHIIDTDKLEKISSFIYSNGLCSILKPVILI